MRLLKGAARVRAVARRIAEEMRGPEALRARVVVVRRGAEGEVERQAAAGVGGEAEVVEVRESESESGGRIGVGDLVVFGRGVYERWGTREARVALLVEAREAAREAVVLHVRVEGERGHVGRALVDGPRVVARALGLAGAEPGDRHGGGVFTHLFFDEEALRAEIAAAGLVIARRKGHVFVLRAGTPAPEVPDTFAHEVARVLARVRAVDDARAHGTPQDVLRAMRARGARTAARGPIGRARLQRAIGWVDALLPGSASCYRRCLLEVALDAGAARETLVFGLDVGRTGHVAFEDREERTFDVSFAIASE